MNNDYYVYLHKRKDNGVVFYVGKGRKDRAKRSRKYKNWLEVVKESGGFEIEYFKTNLTESEAFDLELELINRPPDGWNLVNKNKTNNKTKCLDFNSINEYLYYDPTSPTGLRWKKWNNSKIRKTSRFAGDVAGYLLKCNGVKGYYALRVNGISVLAHRVVWLLVNKSIPTGLVINHKDGNGFNNNISNLEAVTQSVNTRRTSKQKSTSNGVYLMKTGNHYYWCANWSDETQSRQTKLFSVAKLGNEEAFRLATEYRKTKMAELNSKFNLGYT